MLEFKVMAFITIIIIFISVFFIHFAFNNFIRVVEMCSIQELPTCNEYNIYMLFLFSFLIVVAFLIVIESTIYYIFKQVEVKVFAGISDSKKLERNLKTLEIRKDEIMRSKRNAHKNYLNRKIEENTYNDLKKRYDSELFEIGEEIKKIKRGEGK